MELALVPREEFWRRFGVMVARAWGEAPGIKFSV